ncbi:hypothetical protein [Fictibacillus phosphorivorans]|uniref:hypothetical protein n=1 Tax=Fictibacillus phosphorivorans TaxID=1221500 RepID=UPI0035E94894
MSTFSVLMVEPNKQPYITQIKNDIQTFENLVHGPVDMQRFYQSPYLILCNTDNGYNLKYLKLLPDHPFFIAKYDGEFQNIERLETEQLRMYLKEKMKKWSIHKKRTN